MCFCGGNVITICYILYTTNLLSPHHLYLPIWYLPPYYTINYTYSYYTYTYSYSNMSYSYIINIIMHTNSIHLL